MSEEIPLGKLLLDAFTECARKKNATMFVYSYESHPFKEAWDEAASLFAKEVLKGYVKLDEPSLDQKPQKETDYMAAIRASAGR